MITTEEINKLNNNDTVLMSDNNSLIRTGKPLLKDCSESLLNIYSIHKIFKYDTNELTINTFISNYNDTIRRNRYKAEQQAEDKKTEIETKRLNDLYHIDYNNLSDLKKAKIKRIEEQLNKKCNFSNIGIMSYKDFFKNHIQRVEAVETDNMINYNRIKFNRMDSDEQQDKYIKSLEKKKIKYEAYLKNDKTFFNINKLQYIGFRLINKLSSDI